MQESQTIPTSAIPEQVNYSNPVESKAPVQPKKSSFLSFGTIANLFRLGLVVILIGSILYLTAGVLNGLSDTVKIESRGNPESCQYDNCISLKAHYKDSTTTWEIQKDWPLKIVVRGAKFSQPEADAIIRCPVQKASNDTLTKIIFLVSQTKIEDCTVGVQ